MLFYGEGGRIMKANNNKNRKIFRLKNGTIEVYKFEPISTEIALFRQNEMKKIPEDDQVLKRDYNDSWLFPKTGVVYECDSYVIRKEPPKSFEEMEVEYQDFLSKYNVKEGDEYSISLFDERRYGTIRDIKKDYELEELDVRIYLKHFLEWYKEKHDIY